MDFDLDYRYALDCEINKDSYRPCDAIRSQLLQLMACKKTLPLAVYFERLKDLLEEYSIKIDDPNGVNTYINSAINIFKNESSRNYAAKNWKSSTKKKIDDGLSISDLLTSENLHLKNLLQLSAKFRDYQNDRTVFIKTLDNHEYPLQTSSINSCRDKNTVPQTNMPCAFNSSPSKVSLIPKNSPTRVPGIFKRKGRTGSLFYCSQSSEGSEINEAAVAYSQKSNDLNHVIEEEKYDNVEKVKKNPFITGLEKHLVDQVINNKMDENEARKIVEDVRKDKPKTFKAPIKDDNNNSKLKYDNRLKGIEPGMIELIENEIVTDLDKANWANISGLEYAKNKIQQVAILPLKRPDLFIGIRSPPKGILLFGPPGTGKTMIGRCIASEANATFFSITSSTLTSKWLGDGEKMMKTLFKVARCLKPSVIFIDEIDSILRTRSDNEQECIRRMKTEFLSQFDGLSSENNDGLLIIGTTNRPQDLDDAVRRRFACKLYIMLPDKMARKQMIIKNMANEKHNLTEQQIDEIAEKTEKYSGSDMKNLCSEAALYSFQDIQLDKFVKISKEEIRHINFEDFNKALNIVKSSISGSELVDYESWNKKFGSEN